MRKFSKKGYIAAGAAAVIVAAGAGTALAYWTRTGSGTGSATTGTSSDFTVVIDSTHLADLTPGGPTDVVAFHVTNPGTGHQNFTSAVASVVDTSNPGCTHSDFAITGTTAAYGNLGPSATVDGSFGLQMIDTGVAQNACKGVTVHLKVDVS
jgi:hypothetical protein